MPFVKCFFLCTLINDKIFINFILIQSYQWNFIKISSSYLFSNSSLWKPNNLSKFCWNDSSFALCLLSLFHFWSKHFNLYGSVRFSLSVYKIHAKLSAQTIFEVNKFSLHYFVVFCTFILQFFSLLFSLMANGL